MADRPAAPPIDDADPLAWLRRWRKVLRLPLSAAEARLVDGQRGGVEPGALAGLLRKVDRAALDAALNRRPLSDEPPQRARFLAGAAAATGDPTLLHEALDLAEQHGARPELTGAIAACFGALDPSRLSPQRLLKLAGPLERVVPQPELVGPTFALLGTPPVRKALQTALPELPAKIADRWRALLAVREQLEGGAPAPDRLEAGLRLLLDAPPGALDALPDQVRFSLAAAALGLEARWPLGSPALEAILASLDPTDLAWAGLAFAHAAGQVRLGRYAAATRAFDRILEHHPHDLRATVLLSQLAAPRLGPVAARDQRPGALRDGFALSLLKPVLVRTDADPLALALHRDLALPGIAPLVLTDPADPPRWFAVDGALPLLGGEAAADRDSARWIAAEGVRIASLLAQLGLILPDLSPGRFTIDASPTRRWLLLADLTGLRHAPQLAEAHLRTVAAAFVREALGQPAFANGPPRPDLSRADAERLARTRSEPPPLRELGAWVEGLS